MQLYIPPFITRFFRRITTVPMSVILFLVRILIGLVNRRIDAANDAVIAAAEERKYLRNQIDLAIVRQNDAAQAADNASRVRAQLASIAN